LFAPNPDMVGQLTAASPFRDRVILFGTDVCFADPEGEIPTLRYLRELLSGGAISRQVFDKITGTNALKVLALYRE